MLSEFFFLSLTLACQQSTDGEGGEAEPGLCNQRWRLPGGPAALPDHSQDVSCGSIGIPFPRADTGCLFDERLLGGHLPENVPGMQHTGIWRCGTWNLTLHVGIV